MPAIYLFLIAVGIVLLIVKAIIEAVSAIAVPIGIIILIGGGVLISYQIYLNLYFKGPKFKNIKESIDEHTKNCNELNDHIEELKSANSDMSSYDYGEGRLYDNSNYRFKRKEWSNNIKNNKVHNCSASVCKNASGQTKGTGYFS